MFWALFVWLDFLMTGSLHSLGSPGTCYIAAEDGLEFPIKEIHLLMLEL